MTGSTELVGVVALFEVTAPARPEPLSAGAKLTRRQAQAVADGVHPLALIRPGIRVHPDAQAAAATKLNADARPLRCGTCEFRVTGHRGYPKCVWRPGVATAAESQAIRKQAPPRFSNGAGTDCRSWWPACSDWKARP